MPQALIPVLATIGIKGLAASVVAYAATAAATTFVSGLFSGSAPKPDASERTLKEETPARIYILGKRRSFGATMLFVNTTDSETVDVWAFAQGPVNAVTQVYLNDDKVTLAGGVVQELSDGAYGKGKVLAGFNLGAPTETAHAPVVSRVADWTEQHRGDRICSGYLIKQGVKSADFLEVYPQGDQTGMSLAIEGQFCHDPRDPASDPLNPETWPYTYNAALHMLWFYMAYRGYDYATRIAPRLSMWVDAANDCETGIPLKGGGTEPKYRGAVMFTADLEPSAIEDQIRQGFDGWTSRDENGCIVVRSGIVYTPTVSIGPDVIADYEVQDYIEAENTLNEVIVRYVSEEHDFNLPEATPWRDDDDIAERGLNSTTADFQVPSHSQARRLAKRMMARNNAYQRGTVRLLFAARNAMSERYVNLHIEEAGEVFFSGVAEIIGGERDFETGGVVLEWRSVDANIDAWNPATEEGEPAPTTTKTYLSPLEIPLIISATANFSDIGETGEGETAGSVTGVRVNITASGPVRDDLTWYARWRVASGPWSEREYTDAEPGPGVSLVTEYVPYGSTVTVEVAYGTGDGRNSPWSASVDVSTSP